MSHALPVRADFRHFEPLRVRWAEIDAQKIVFNGHYLMYFDTAVAGYWRALGLPYAQSMERLQGDLYVRKATLEYHASALYDDRIDVGLRCARIGSSSMTLVAAVFRDATLLVSGELVYVFADPHTQTSRPVPQALRDILLGFEAGEDMVEVAVGGWDEQRTEAMALREEERDRPAGLLARSRIASRPSRGLGRGRNAETRGGARPQPFCGDERQGRRIPRGQHTVGQPAQYSLGGHPRFDLGDDQGFSG